MSSCLAKTVNQKGQYFGIGKAGIRPLRGGEEGEDDECESRQLVLI